MGYSERHKTTRDFAMPSAEIEAWWHRDLQEGYTGARRLTAAEHPQLIARVRQMAQDAKVAEPLLYSVSEINWVAGSRGPNLVAYNTGNPRLGNAVIISESALKTLDYSAHSSEVSKPLLAGIGHELGHFSQGANYSIVWRKWPIILGPAIGLGAVALLSYAEKQAGEKRERLDSTHFDAAEAKLRAQLNIPTGPEPTVTQITSPKESIHHTKQAAFGASKYLAGAAIGLVGGMLTTRHAIIQREYDADRIAACLVKDPKAVVECLEKITKASEEYAVREMPEIMKQMTFKKVYDELIPYAHPSFAQRAKKLLEMKPHQLEFSNGLAH